MKCSNSGIVNTTENSNLGAINSTTRVFILSSLQDEIFFTAGDAW
jgi:hypothetical protein